MSPSPGDAWYPTRASLANRELGLARPRAFLADVASRRRDALSLAGDKTLSMPWASGVNALRVDETEHRYLLAGATDATIAVYDTAQPSRVDPRTGVATHDPILRVRRGAGDGAARSPGHAFAVSSVDWYPVDTGMFFTASFDQTVAGWDANACARVVDFAFEDKVYCIATAKGGRGGGIGGGGGETAPRTLPFARRASLGPRVWFGLTRGGMQLHQSRELRITDARLSTLDPSQAAAGSPAPSSASSAASSPPPSLSLSLSRARVGTSSTSPRARWRFSRRCTPRGRTIDSSPRTSILFPRRRSRASARRWSRRRRVLLPSFLAPVLARPRSRLRRSPREGRTGLYLPGRAGVSLRPRPLGFDRHRRAATPASRLD